METKICNTCEIEKNHCDFSKRSDSDYLRSDCIQCRRDKNKVYSDKNRDKINAKHRDRYTWDDHYRYKDLNDAARERKRKNYHDKKERFQISAMKSKYGLEIGEYEEMYDQQDSSCAICYEFINHIFDDVHYDKKANIDHCHETGEVRGLLCSRCNKGIGLLRDDLNILESAISYLKS